MGKIIISRDDRCLACRTCEIACAMAHSKAKTLAEAVHCDPPPHPRVHVEPLGEGSIALQCRHCEDAPCVAICPTGALSRLSEDGPVSLDPDRCIGCKYCIVICPFGAIEMSPDGKVASKCDLCAERTEAGKLPACVEACPTHALIYTEIESWLKRRRGEAARRVAKSQALTDAP
jgi:carbon-monoxide dehydrogenase iron sulfur subunit